MFQLDRKDAPEFIKNCTLSLLVYSLPAVLASVLLMWYFSPNMTNEDVRKINEQIISLEDAKNLSEISSDIDKLKLILRHTQDNLTSIGTDLESMFERIEKFHSYSTETDAKIISNHNAIEEIKENVKELNDALYKKENEMAIQIANNNKRIVSLEADLRNCNSRLETLTDKNAKSYSTLENKLNILSQEHMDIEGKYKELQKKMSETEMEIKEQGQTDERLEKSSKENINYMKKVEITSYWVDIILVFIILILLIKITTMTKEGINRNTGVGVTPDQGKAIQLEKKPAIVSFNPFSYEAHRRLADLFLDDYHYIVVNSSQDISKIHSKVVYLFVDFNDRNIILEAETETQQIKRETVETMRRIGGKPVVIYRLHSESRNLEKGKLYSDKLTSIQSHPTLRELSANNCVLSIDKEFNEYQRIHLLKLLEN